MFKSIQQDGLKDCGPTCLLMVIKHYKGNIDIETLKEMCQTTKNGTTAYHLIEASKQCGFSAHGIKCQIEDWTEDNLMLPCIAHVIINNSYNHYVVIYKVDFKRKRMLIGDPATKTKYYSFKEFSDIFNGILIYLYPIKKIPQEASYNLIDFLKRIISKSKNQLIQIVVISLFITLFAIISTFYFQYMIDNIVTDKSKLALIFIIFSIVYLLKIIADFCRNKVLILINQKTDLELTYKTFKQIILLPYHYYRNHTTGEIISRITDLRTVREVISKVALSLFIDLPLAVISLIILFCINKTLCLIAVIILLLYILIVILFKNSYTKHINEGQVLQADVTSYMVESISGFESVKGNNMETKIIQKMETKYITYLKKLAKLDICFNRQYILKEIVNSGGFLIIILVGCLLVIKDQLSIGQLLSFNALLVYFSEPIRQTIDLDGSIKEASNAIKRILKLLIIEKNAGCINNRLTGDIKFNHLSYKFNEKEVLKDISLTIKQGNKVMITGNSGGGKSTLLKILKKYYPIKRNSLLVGENDINDYLQNDIIYISQNETLFTDTILNNIGGGEVVKLTKLCLIDEIIKDNQLGYNMLIEENGFNISGGQKQRIILARSLNQDFNILLIDEGLSQVDTNTERKILKNLFEHYPTKTIVFVSHRLDNMDLFDQLIEITEGVKTKDVTRNG